MCWAGLSCRSPKKRVLSAFQIESRRKISTIFGFSISFCVWYGLFVMISQFFITQQFSTLFSSSSSTRMRLSSGPITSLSLKKYFFLFSLKNVHIFTLTIVFFFSWEKNSLQPHPTTPVHNINIILKRVKSSSQHLATLTSELRVSHADDWQTSSHHVITAN